MALWARVVNRIVVEVAALPDGVSVADAFHPTIADTMIAIPAGVTVVQGMAWNGSAFTPAPAPTLTPAALAQYAGRLCDTLSQGPITVAISGAGNVVVGLDAVGAANLAGALQRLSLPNPPASFNWQVGSTADFAPGNELFATVTAAQLQDVAAKAADYVQGCYNTLQRILAQITAGAITTEAQVLGAGWPSQRL